MKKILFYIYSLNKGGAERVLLTVAEQLSRADDISVVVLTDVIDSNEYDYSFNIERINLEKIDDKKKNATVNKIGRLFAIRRAIKKENPDKVVAFMVSNATRAILALMGTKYKVIAAVRSNPYDEYGDKKQRAKLCRIFSHAQSIVCQTESQREFFEAIRPTREIILNPISGDFCVAPFEGKREKTIVATGRLYDYKNHKLLIDAFYNIASEFYDYRLIIYGEGPYRKELEAEIDKLDKESPRLNFLDRVILAGDSDNVAEEILRSSIYVLPSDTEGLPNALLEAMSLGLPCISTDCPCGGPRSVIRDGENGLLVPVGNVELMTNALRKLLIDESLRKQIGRAAVNIREVCSLEAIMKKWKLILGLE